MTTEAERKAAWEKFDEPIKAVIFASLDVSLAEAVAEALTAVARAAGTRHALRMYFNSVLQKHRDAGVSEEVLAEGIGAGSPFHTVLTSLDAEYEGTVARIQKLRNVYSAARMTLSGEGMKAWRSLPDSHRAHVVADLNTEHSRTIAKNKKNMFDGAGLAAGAGMISAVSDMAGNDSTDNASAGFQVGYGAGIIVDNAIVDAFQAALNMLFDGES